MNQQTAITRSEIEKRLNIARTKFNVDVKPFMKQVPSLINANLYDLQTFLEFEKTFKKRSPGRPKKKVEIN